MTIGDVVNLVTLPVTITLKMERWSLPCIISSQYILTEFLNESVRHVQRVSLGVILVLNYFSANIAS